MEWEELNLHNKADEAKHTQEQKKQKAIDMAKAYHRCFKTESGQKVLQDLVNRFIMNNNPQTNETNITYVAGMCNGQSDLVQYIMGQVQRAEIL